MKRAFSLLLLILALILGARLSVQAQTLHEAAEEVKVELRDQFKQKLITSNEVDSLIPPLARIYELEEELRPVEHEDRPTLGERCERIIRVNELRESFEQLRAVKIRNRRARERLRPLLDDLQSVIEAYGPGDDGACKKLKESV